MATNQGPPPLFDDEESRNDDSDIFASAVQSPLNDGLVAVSQDNSAGFHPLLESDTGLPSNPSSLSDKSNESVHAHHYNITPQPDIFESCSQSVTHDMKEISLDDNDQTANQEASNNIQEQFSSHTNRTSTSITNQENGFSKTSPVTSLEATAQIQPSSLSTGYPTSVKSSVIPSAANASSLVRQKDREEDDMLLELQVTDPHKIGDGIGSYVAYKLTTKTNIPYFRKKNWSVTRRFSDFLGLHSKLVEKYVHSGVIIPPAPEKAPIATTKIKLTADKSADSSSAEFIERRRAALERFMNRTAAHAKLRADPDFREFLELDAELPKATSTSAISGAGVLRLFNFVGETVNKLTFKMDESDQWFEEKTQHIENLDAQLRKLHVAMESLVSYRRELANSTCGFSKSAAVLSSVEEHTALSRALHQLSEATEKIHVIHHAQADADFFHLSETTKDYISLIGAVKEVFHERVKAFQTWQHAVATLAKKRENTAKLEVAGRSDKVDQSNEEVREWEMKVERGQEEFNKISKAIKAEMEQFDMKRLEDFKEMFIKYLEALITSQLQIVKVWESFLPEAKAIA